MQQLFTVMVVKVLRCIVLIFLQAVFLLCEWLLYVVIVGSLTDKTVSRHNISFIITGHAGECHDPDLGLRIIYVDVN